MLHKDPARGDSAHLDHTASRRMVREWDPERARGRARRILAEAHRAHRRVKCWGPRDRAGMAAHLSILAGELEGVPQLFRGESWGRAARAVMRAAAYHGVEVWHDGRPWTVPSTFDPLDVMPGLCAVLAVLLMLSALL